MIQAIITINEKMSENVEVKLYNGLKTMFITAETADRAADLLRLHSQDKGTEAEPAQVVNPVNDAPRYRVIDLEVIKREAQHFRRTKEGRAFVQKAKNANQTGLSIAEQNYLEALILLGKTEEAFNISCSMGKEV